LNGNLIIERGVFKLNNDEHPDPVADIRRTIIIKKDLIVQSNGKFRIGTANTNNSALDLGNGGGPYVFDGTTGTNGAAARIPESGKYHNIYHQIEIWGNFENSGEAKFTNQAQPIYNQLNGSDGLTSAYTGSAVVIFKGSTNKQALLHGITDFYHLIIDKGDTQSSIFSIDASDESYFRLFGSNFIGGVGGGTTPEIRMALWIKNGTLRLTGNVNIPTLTQGNGGGTPNTDFFVTLNSGLWIDGAKVKVTAASQEETEIGGLQGTLVDGVGRTTGNIWSGAAQSFSLYGSFKITQGELNSGSGGGIIVWSLGNPSFDILKFVLRVQVQMDVFLIFSLVEMYSLQEIKILPVES